MESVMITVWSTCPRCKKEKSVDLPRAGYEAWRSGELIQHALPMLTPDERESLITGICQTCWDVMFGDNEGDEYNAD